MLQCAPARPPPRCCPLLPRRLWLPLLAQPRHPWLQPLPTLLLPLPRPLLQALRTVQGNCPRCHRYGAGRREWPHLAPCVGSCVPPQKGRPGAQEPGPRRAGHVGVAEDRRECGALPSLWAREGPPHHTSTRMHARTHTHTYARMHTHSKIAKGDGQSVSGTGLGAWKRSPGLGKPREAPSREEH